MNEDELNKAVKNILTKFIEPKEKLIEELESQIKKMGEALIDLLAFEGYLEPYMYECDEIRNGDLLEPFNDARKLLNSYKCRKCKGTGYVLTKKWKDKVTCPTCNGNCYIFRK